MSNVPRTDINWVNPPSRYLRREHHRRRTTVRREHYAATTAEVGNPGVFAPYGAITPADFAAMSSITASPTTDWPLVDQHVVLEDASLASWYNAQWNVGKVLAATGADEGAPGDFTPAGSAHALNLAAMSGITPNPATLWDVAGEHVVLNDGSHAFYNGSAWEAGDVPLADTAVAGAPGTWTPTYSPPAVDMAAMSVVTASPATAWTTGQHVTLGDASDAYWDGDSWEVGQAP
jgi:hypothetical protein